VCVCGQEGAHCHGSTACALIDVELQVLSKAQYKELVEYFPEFKQLLQLVARVCQLVGVCTAPASGKGVSASGGVYCSS
jgi:hypothetical protein